MPNRRAFLEKIVGGAAAMAGAGFGLPGAAGAEGDEEIAEVRKSPRLLVGCCAYSYGKYLQHGPMTMEDFIREGVKLRVDNLDMTTYYYKSTNPSYLASLRHLAYELGIPFSGVACGTRMVHAESSRRAEALKEIKNWVDVTEMLGASHLRIFAGTLPHSATLGQAMSWVGETMKAACDYSRKKGIMLGLQDNMGITRSPEVSLELMHRVNSPYAGINLDITHFVPTAASNSYGPIEGCIPFATVTHIRDYYRDGTPIDLDRVWRLFAQVGFKGCMSVEYGGKEDPMTSVPMLVEKVRALCKKYSSV